MSSLFYVREEYLEFCICLTGIIASSEAIRRYSKVWSE